MLGKHPIYNHMEMARLFLLFPGRPGNGIVEVELLYLLPAPPKIFEFNIINCLVMDE